MIDPAANSRFEDPTGVSLLVGLATNILLIDLTVNSLIVDPATNILLINPVDISLSIDPAASSHLVEDILKVYKLKVSPKKLLNFVLEGEKLETPLDHIATVSAPNADIVDNIIVVNSNLDNISSIELK